MSDGLPPYSLTAGVYGGPQDSDPDYGHGDGGDGCTIWIPVEHSHARPIQVWNENLCREWDSVGHNFCRMNPDFRDRYANSCPRHESRETVTIYANPPDPTSVCINGADVPYECVNYGIPYSVAGLGFGVCLAMIIMLTTKMYMDRRKHKSRGDQQQWGC
ncbi:hypothetical protein F5Y04DRAFT_276168 [Hypomontagnella monticulosa]|nr:hypothetical protein F5Y04DRAFT_276168 [Hypomontagnella monticulosa]